MEVKEGQEVDHIPHPAVASIIVEHIADHVLDQGVAHAREIGTRKRNPSIAINTRRRKVNHQDIDLRPQKSMIPKTVVPPPILPWSY